MSPASQGGLQVEHYIGSNLISASARVTLRGHGRARRDGKPVNPLTTDYLLRNGRAGYPIPGVVSTCDGGFPLRHGVGWAGLPLITMAPHKVGKRTPTPGKGPQQFQARKVFPDEERTPLSRLAIHTQGAPLIHAGKCNIQRKPQLKNNRGDVIVRRNNKYKDSRGVAGPSDNLSVASDESSGSGQLENILPRIIKPRKRRKKDRKPCPTPSESVEGIPTPPETTPRSHSAGMPDDPQLHHRFEDVAESDVPCPQSSCQCHYCDPSGIWDSPGPDLVLRRSWSEPLPGAPRPLQRSYSLGAADGKEVPWESLKGCDISVKESEQPRPAPRTPCLEVSTEIVTSLHGHRDLEIRFYSASPPS